MGCPVGDFNVLQIHPTRRCNLRCHHCYSSSAPNERDSLSLAILQGALSDARAEGFDVVSISGGEPLLYSDLPKLLESACQEGFQTSITTNGILLNKQRLAALRDHLHLVAISLDGIPSSHNRVRNSPRAFEQMAANLVQLRNSGIPFGFIFTLTQFNLDELEWVTEFAIQQKARLLQIHPLDETGRAAERMVGAAPDKMELAYAFLESARLQAEAPDSLLIHLDVIEIDYVRENPHRFYAKSLPEDPTTIPFTEIVSPLVIEPDGTISPVQYGFAPQFTIGNLHAVNLAQALNEWKATKARVFTDMAKEVHRRIKKPCKTPFVYWYTLLNEQANRYVLNTTPILRGK